MSVEVQNRKTGPKQATSRQDRGRSVTIFQAMSLSFTSDCCDTANVMCLVTLLEFVDIVKRHFTTTTTTTNIYFKHTASA